MLSEPDWTRLQQIVEESQIRDAEALGLLSRKAVEERMRAAAERGHHPLKPACFNFQSIEEALDKEFGAVA